MMKALYSQEGAELDISILSEKPARDFITTHADILNSSFEASEMSDTMRRHLEDSNYIFSGMKTFHELNEAFPSLIDEKGERKPFERFLNDVQTIDETYNKNYLRSEYNFVAGSAQMAERWEQFAKDGDDYNLQYRTAGDSRVRPEHAALNGITLPFSDRFWNEYYPPNGWNCRCTVVQVRKGKYEETPQNEVYERAAKAISSKDDMFRFNPGKEEKAVPDYNPYTIRQCKNCPVADENMSLGKFIPSNEVCQACAILHECVKKKNKSASAIERQHYIHEMEPLLKKKVTLATDVKDINAGFTKYGNKHLYSDTHGRSKVLTKDDLKTLDKTMTGAKYIDKADLTHQRQDNIEEFFYYEAELHGTRIRLNVAKKVEKFNSGYVQETYFLYSINDIKKSTSGGA